MGGGKKSILFLEDDPLILRSVEEALGEEGYSVTLTRTVGEARGELKTQHFDLVLMDLNLPDGNSFGLCRELREEHPALPIVFVTASVDEESAVKGLSLGATDYLRKPFGKSELLLRIRNFLKLVAGQLKAGSLQLELDRRTASNGKKAIDLTPTEFTILAALMERPGEAISHDRIMTILHSDGEGESGALPSHLSRIRAKLKKAGVTEVAIKPVYGWGYRLEKKAA